MSNRKKQQDLVSEHLNQEVLDKLRAKKSELKHVEEEKLEQDRQRRAEERKRKEENKSFEQLLNESELDWKSFKK
ncbi:YqkE family protein [Halobacillus ihumii]|uniref:YqkE family protein n=1 Tax=Halobacillus ihumii TaxID=2686092 RepID=UPI0013D246BA|nr:YqkE family protein [Halobacillus ihumii]